MTESNQDGRSNRPGEPDRPEYDRKPKEDASNGTPGADVHDSRASADSQDGYDTQQGGVPGADAPNHPASAADSGGLPQQQQATTPAATGGNDGPPDGGKRPWKAGRVWAGIGLVLLLHLIPLLMPVAYFFIGVAQLVYVIPALIICRKDTGMMQGILIAAGVTFLINAACFGIVLGSNFSFT